MQTDRAISWSVGVCLLVLAGGVGLARGDEISHAEYRPDTRFPEYLSLWWEGWPWQDENGEKVLHAYPGMPLGGYLQCYVKNDTTGPLVVDDVLLNGVSVNKTVAPENPEQAKPGELYPSSIQFSKLPEAEIETISQAGEPVWWKVDPPTLQPGQVGQITLRLRREPKVSTLNVKVLAGTTSFVTQVQVKQAQPRIFSAGFAPDMQTVTLYLRHPSGQGIAPQKILLDGRDITSRTRITCDAKVETVPVILTLDKPAIEAEYHCFEALYADGGRAAAGIRAWEPEFRYGMWGYPQQGNDGPTRARQFLERMYNHNINTLMWSWGGDVQNLAETPAGQKLVNRIGMRFMSHIPNSLPNLLYNFLTDEPDAADWRSQSINPPSQRLGSLGQALVEKAKLWRREAPGTLQLLNTDATFEPEQYYTYGQLPDIPCIDRYYQGELQGAYYDHPDDYGAMAKPTSIYAAGTVFQSACAPKPMHIILESALCGLEQKPFRQATTAEKRIEVYYALAAGAKGLSYWWYTAYGDCPGVGGDSFENRLLMNEIGLLGAEVCTAGPLWNRSCPVNLPVKAPRLAWVRTLLIDDDAIAVIVVNDNILCDRQGTIVRPIDNVRAAVTLPTWLKAGDVFELTGEGTRDITWQQTAGQASAELGQVELVRVLFIAGDKSLRSQIQKRYDTLFAERVRKLRAQRPTR